MAFFLRKIILAETYYKTHNQELWAIMQAFKTWLHYFKGCKYKVFVLTYNNNFC